jgi:hypothetical protein
MGTYFLVHGSAENYFVGGRSLPFPVLVMTLTAQSLDSNALLGNVDLSYKYSFWDGTFRRHDAPRDIFIGSNS